MSELRIGLIDSNELVRVGRNLVINSQSDLRVVLEESDAQVAIQRAPDYLVDVLVVAENQHGFTGSGFVEKLSSALGESQNNASILVLASFATEQARWNAVQAGAADLIGMEADGATFLKAIRAIGKPGFLVDPSFVHSFGKTQPLRPLSLELQVTFDDLTAEQRSQFSLFLQGKSDFEIARMFDVSRLRVRQLIESLIVTAGLRTRGQLSLLLRGFVK